MNWKFWRRWDRRDERDERDVCDGLWEELEAARRELLQGAAVRAALECEARGLVERCAELSTRVDGMYQRTPKIVTEAARSRADLQRLLVLASVEEDNALWRTMLSYVDEYAENETNAALTRGLADGPRQHETGRAASAQDLAYALRDLRVKAVVEARKLERKKD